MRNFAYFLLVLFIIAAFLRISFFFTVLYLFLALSLMSRFWMRRRMASLRVERRYVDRAFFGDQVTVDVTVHNTGWLPIPWLELRESLPITLVSPPITGRVVSLGPHERWHMTYTLNCRRRGYYRIGPMTMQSGDLLGLEPSNTGQVIADHLIVYPKVVPLHRLNLPTRSPHVALPAQAPLFEDPTRIAGVRDYQWGDSPRRIHWTATANVGRLLVKRYQPAIARDTLICLDLDEADYDPMYVAAELAIVVAASVASHVILREGLTVGLATEAQDPLSDDQIKFFLPPRSERAHLMGLLEVLARAQVASGTSFSDRLRRESVRMAWGATLFIITGRESTELFDTLLYLRRAGFAVALVLVQPGQPSAGLRKRSDVLNLPIHRVWREQDLKAWR